MAVKSVVVKKSPRISEDQYREKLGLKRLDVYGAEMPDPIPMEPPVGYKKQPSIFENMRAMVKAELERQAKDQGFETSDEAENFDIPEDHEPISRHVYTEMDEEYVKTSVSDHNKKVAEAKSAAKAALEAPKAPAPKAGQGPAKPARAALDAPEEGASED